MADVFIHEQYLTDIADAIRSKLDTEDTYKPSEMAEAIDSISGGGITPTGTKEISITENGITTEDVTNYANAEISVLVPSGKVSTPYTLDFPRRNGIALGGKVNYSYNEGTIKIEVTSSFSHYVLNYTDLLFEVYNSSTITNNKPLWFTMPANSVCVLKTKNVTNSANATWNVAMKTANGTTQFFANTNGTHLQDEDTTQTIESATDVGCIYTYIASGAVGDVIQFDMEFYVDGTRYF